MDFTALALGDQGSLAVFHLAIRATVQPDTTRCELYPRISPNFYTPRNRGDEKYYDYYCFSDVTVNEYIVGTGPSELTVIMHREIILDGDDDLDWENEEASYLVAMSDPRSRTADTFEGRELVMVLSFPVSIAVESWDADLSYGRWFVQRDDPGDIRAVALEISLATAAQRSAWDLPLSTLVSRIKAAAATRAAQIAASESDSGAAARSVSGESSSTTSTLAGLVHPTGGLGEEGRSKLPVLVTDANRLRDAFMEIGAVYEGDDATTVLPPPNC